MKLAKTLVVVACAGLLSFGGFGSTRHAYAQDDAAASDLGEGSWGSAALGNGEDTSPEAKKATEDIDGCWTGSVHDKSDKEGDAFFFFDQDGKVLETDSEFEFEWPDSSFAESPTIAKGSVDSKGFKMKSPNLPPGKCTATISGGLKKGVLKGKAKFHDQCAKRFKNVTFSVTPEPCF